MTELWHRLIADGLPVFERIGLVIIGAGLAKMGWWGDDNIFGAPWGPLVIGATIVLLVWIVRSHAR